MSKFNTSMMLGAAVGMIAMFIALTVVMNSGRADSLAPEVAALPKCDPATMADTDPPCRFAEDGETFIYWDGIKSKPGPAPTMVPRIYLTHSIHPAILATAEAEGITLSLDDYEEVFAGVVHSHFPIECDEMPFCSELWMHRFDSHFGMLLGSPGHQTEIHSRGIEYVKVNGDLYLDDLSQLSEPTPVSPSPTRAAD